MLPVKIALVLMIVLGLLAQVVDFFMGDGE